MEIRQYSQSDISKIMMWEYPRKSGFYEKVMLLAFITNNDLFIC